MTDYTWDGGGDGTSWTDDDNWGGSGHPNSINDKATINVGSASISMNIAGGTAVVGEVYLGSSFTGTVTQAYGLTIDKDGSENGVLEINNSSATWNCNGSTLIVDSHIKGNGTFTVGTSTVTCTGQTTVGTFNITTGTYNYFDDFRPTTANITDNATINQTSSGGQLGGRIIITASKTPTFNGVGRFHSSFRIDSGEQGNSTINLDLSENQTGPSRALYFYNLELDSLSSGDPHTITMAGAITCTGKLTITDGVIDTGSDHALTVTGDVDIATAGTLTTNASAVTVGAISTTGNATYNATTHTNGTIINSRHSSLGRGLSMGSVDRLVHNNGKIVFQGASALQGILINGTATATVGLYDVEINSTAAADCSLQGDVDIYRNLTVTAGELSTHSTQNYTLTVGGGVSGAGTLTTNASEVSFGYLIMSGTYNATTHANGTILTDRSGPSAQLLMDAADIVHNDGLFVFKGSSGGSSYCALNGDSDATNGLYNVKIDASSRTVNISVYNLSIHNDLTVEAGTFNTTSDDWTLTVGGQMHSKGTFTSNSSTVTVRNLVIEGGTFNSPDGSGMLNITGEGDSGYGDGYAFRRVSGAFVDNTGTVTFKTPSTTSIRMGTAAQDFYNVIFNESSAGGIYYVNDEGFTVTNNCTITAGDFDTTLGTATPLIDIQGTLTIASGHTFGGITQTQTSDISIGALTINGTFKATSGTTTVTGTYTQNGTFTHNDGLLHISNGGQTMTGTSPMGPFYDLKSSGDNNEIRKNMAVENSFIIATGYVRPTVANADWKIGTTSAAGYISGSVSTPVRVFDNEIGSATFTVSGASTVYPAQLKGNEWAWTQTGQSQTAAIAFGNVDVQFDVDTSTGADNTVEITLTGDCEFDNFILSAGDKLDLNGQRAQFSGNLSNQSTGAGNGIDYDGMLYFTGSGRMDSDGASSNLDLLTLVQEGTSTTDADLAGDNLIKTFLYNQPTVTQKNHRGAIQTIVGAGTWTCGSGETPDFTDLTVATDGTLDGSTSTLTVAGDLKMSGGLIGKSAAVFNGSSQEADFGDPSEFELTSTMTIEAWVKPESTSGLQGIVGKVLFGSAGAQEWGLSSEDSRWFFKCGNTSSNGTAKSSSTFSTGKWYHIAATKDSSGVMRLYVNGKQDQLSVPTVTGDCNPTYNFVMGRRASAADFFFEGTLGLVRIFNTERTQAQIRTDMFNDFSNMDSTTGLVACYQFDTGTGTTIYDSTSNNLDSSSSDATWAGAGSFTGGTSTLFLNKNGTQYITYLDTDYVAGLKIGADSTTIMQDIVGNNHAIYVSGNLTVSGTLQDTSQEYLRIPNDFVTLGSAIDVSNGDVSEVQIVFDNSAGNNINLPASTWKEVDINYGTVTLTGDVTSNNTWRVRQHGSAITKVNGNTLTVSGACNIYSGATLDLTNSSTLLFNTAGGEFLSDADSTLLAGGGGVTIKGYTSGDKTDFDSQNDFKVVGTVENLNVTNEELSVTGKVINCTGEVIQQHQSVDAAQQLDFDSAEDRDIMLGRDLDKNTELVG